MIKFCGEITEKSKKFIINKNRFVLFIASILPVSVAIVITIFLTIKFHLIYLLFLIPLLFWLIFPLIPLSKKTLDKMIPTKILITSRTITSEGNNFACTRQLSDIKQVVDYGDFYQIYFKWPNKSYNFLAQKSLLTEGTIEDFEKLFKDKIKRMNKKV